MSDHFWDLCREFERVDKRSDKYDDKYDDKIENNECEDIVDIIDSIMPQQYMMMVMPPPNELLLVNIVYYMDDMMWTTNVLLPKCGISLFKDIYVTMCQFCNMTSTNGSFLAADTSGNTRAFYCCDWCADKFSSINLARVFVGLPPITSAGKSRRRPGRNRRNKTKAR